MNPGIPAASLIVLACAAGNRWLVADPVLHVLLQLPLLAASGSLLVPPQRVVADWRWAAGGIAPLIMALNGVAFWMLPRSIDGAVDGGMMSLAKFVSLPVIGALITVCWRRGHALLLAFVKAQVVSMAGFLAFLYTHSPVRLCNSYLIDDQWRLGVAFLWLGVALAGYWALGLFRVPASIQSELH